MRRTTLRLIAAVLVAFPAYLPAQGGGEVDYGDMIRILRDEATARPILQKRWIEYPGDAFDWGYCPIPLSIKGEIPFVELSCDPDPAFAAEVMEVDLGRLNEARTQERNIRMHFNETIGRIQDAEYVDLDPAGRLELGSGCSVPPGSIVVECTSWKVVDSPQENLALYWRILKFGHIQTDPLEENPWAHGDPTLPTQYHPALRDVDWPKFSARVQNLLPMGGGPSFTADRVRLYAPGKLAKTRRSAPLIGCFDPIWPNGFNPACAERELPSATDFVFAASTLGGAADKDGVITPDVLAYFHRILRLPVATDYTPAPLVVLPALIRLEDGTTIIEAPPGLPEPADEVFVDFSAVVYRRSTYRDETFASLIPLGPGLWGEEPELPLLAWLEFVNGQEPSEDQTLAPGFIAAANDGLRCVEFVHNYEIPGDLGWDFDY
ncbi:MAG: hypothetical protein AMXMBFR36_25190 [Acidobacteriota bacterium]